MTVTRSIIQGGTGGNRCFHPCIFHDGSVFRLFFHQTPDSTLSLQHRQSVDAYSWGLQTQVLPPPSPAGPYGYGSSVLDEGPLFLPSSERYKLAFYNNNVVNGQEVGNVYLAVSADGIHWSVKATLWSNSSGYASDILTLWRNPLYPRGGFVYGLWIAHVVGGVKHLWVSHCQGDFVNWTTPDPCFYTDPWDSGATQFYGATAPLVRTAADGNPVAISFLRVLREDIFPANPSSNPARGIGWTVLAYSRDCATWMRKREPWLEGIPGTFDQSICWVWGACEKDGILYASYSGFPDGHKPGERYACLATMPSSDLVLP